MNWFYSNEGYYSLKSGFYFDHYFKLFFHRIYKEIVLYSGMIFMDKFVINKLINNIFLAILNINEKIANFKKKKNMSSIKKILLILSIVIVFILFYIF